MRSTTVTTARQPSVTVSSPRLPGVPGAGYAGARCAPRVNVKEDAEEERGCMVGRMGVGGGECEERWLCVPPAAVWLVGEEGEEREDVEREEREGMVVERTT